ncbi:MAG: hypothetical protein WDO13_20260 [Verrucomicrobiota bacterium]
MEGSRVSEPDRCAFITSFIYRKMADVAVALEVDYFDQMTLFGPSPAAGAGGRQSRRAPGRLRHRLDDGGRARSIRKMVP